MRGLARATSLHLLFLVYIHSWSQDALPSEGFPSGEARVSFIPFYTVVKVRSPCCPITGIRSEHAMCRIATRPPIDLTAVGIPKIVLCFVTSF